MLDNPQSKLNQQVQSQQAQSNSLAHRSTQQAQNEPLKPDKPNTNPDLPATVPPNQLQDGKGNKTQTPDEEVQQGFASKLKQKIAQRAETRLMQSFNGPRPEQKSTQTDQPGAKPAPNSPKAPQRKSKPVSPNYPRPQMPQMVKMPKMPKRPF